MRRLPILIPKAFSLPAHDQEFVLGHVNFFLQQLFQISLECGPASTIASKDCFSAIRSRPDGYALFLLTISHAINASLHEKLPYNIVHDTTPIASFSKRTT
jgi:hypothetical protein